MASIEIFTKVLKRFRITAALGIFYALAIKCQDNSNKNNSSGGKRLLLFKTLTQPRPNRVRH